MPRPSRKSKRPGSHLGLKHETPSFSASPWISRLIVAVLAVGLTWMFWWPLWQGGGLIGGDLYPYYFPQKVFLAESLQSGVLPLWNPWVGFGYPVLGESQTAALYPPNLLLYSMWPVNDAYNLSQLGHYILAFIGAVLLGRRLGLSLAGALLAATVFVYGWFPARICLEWAIIGGAWFVWILWGATGYLQTGRQRYLMLTGLFLGLDLLAGHYNLAFITLLTLVPLALLVPRLPSVEATPESAANGRKVQRLRLGGLGVALIAGFLVAGVQLVPTWELKSVSQRQQVNEVFAPTYGHLPVTALSQLWNPWAWYAAEQPMDQMLGGGGWAVPALTNQAEAQFYLGLIPLALAVLGLALPRLRRDLKIAHPFGWLALTVIALFFATGWPIAWMSSVPGFGFFRGPGRYSMTAALAIAVLAGASFDALLRRFQMTSRGTAFVTSLVIAVTAADLWAASRQYQFQSGPFFGRQVFYATLLNDPPINHLHESELRKYFLEQGDNTRLYAPGQNIPSLLHVSALPVYLGLGPEIYESKEIRVDFTQTDPAAIADAVARLRRFGVTHLLLEQPLDISLWPVKSIGAIIDPFLNRALARSEPYYFYQVQDSPGRVSANGGIQSVKVEANSVQVEAGKNQSGTVTLRDLAYPGWKLNPSAAATGSEPCDELFRCGELKNAESTKDSRTLTWTYRPASVFWGSVLSLIGTLLLIAIAWKPRTHGGATGSVSKT